MDGGDVCGWWETSTHHAPCQRTCVPSSPIPPSGYWKWCTRFEGTPVYVLKFKLPNGYKCDRCILQWQYTTGHKCHPPCISVSPRALVCAVHSTITQRSTTKQHSTTCSQAASQPKPSNRSPPIHPPLTRHRRTPTTPTASRTPRTTAPTSAPCRTAASPTPHTPKNSGTAQTSASCDAGVARSRQCYFSTALQQPHLAIGCCTVLVRLHCTANPSPC